MGMVLRIFCFVILLPKFYLGDKMMRGELLGLVKSTSGAVVMHYVLVPRPLCLVQARSTLSELDKSVVRPEVRKETDSCQEKGNTYP